MSKDILVSIPILIYNNSTFLKKTVDSVLKQTYPSMEVIISDDCSKNYDEVLIEKQKRRLEEQGIKVIINHNEENIGTVKHLNKVIDIMTGQIMCNLACGDCFYNKDTIRTIVKHFQNSNYLVLTAKRMCINEENEKELFILPSKVEQRIIEKSRKKTLNLICNRNVISGSVTYYHRNVFEKYGKFDERMRLLEDWPYYIKLLMANEKIGFLDEITILYRWGGVSNSKKRHPLLIKDEEILINEILLKNKNKFTLSTRRMLEFRNIRQFGDRSKLGLFYYISHIDVVTKWVYWYKKKKVQNKRLIKKAQC
ncbi:glycosyltransferase [Anaerosacchariphilus polymeriproducens]|uniref:Glycosyltransferase n=1 Tax=Anaerosacchariphilus polymeriproducens TaxID=1812858 RepID=A0A371ARD5_9FIRM|nr:glycosyltransferase [Anaerosacchariphilus polymeriproducens]RDU22118.1 glycosyltransferase [Anaerosacchariphilus polymeriproducens]